MENTLYCLLCGIQIPCERLDIAKHFVDCGTKVLGNFLLKIPLSSHFQIF